MTAAQPAPRYTVRQGMHAYYTMAVHDALAGPNGAPCCWCGTSVDAERIAAALNRDEMFRQALRAMLTEKVVGEIERGEGG